MAPNNDDEEDNDEKGEDQISSGPLGIGGTSNPFIHWPKFGCDEWQWRGREGFFVFSENFHRVKTPEIWTTKMYDDFRGGRVMMDGTSSTEEVGDQHPPTHPPSRPTSTRASIIGSVFGPKNGIFGPKNQITDKNDFPGDLRWV